MLNIHILTACEGDLWLSKELMGVIKVKISDGTDEHKPPGWADVMMSQVILGAGEIQWVEGWVMTQQRLKWFQHQGMQQLLGNSKRPGVTSPLENPDQRC